MNMLKWVKLDQKIFMAIGNVRNIKEGITTGHFGQYWGWEAHIYVLLYPNMLELMHK